MRERIVLFVGLLAFSRAASAANEDAPVPPRIATVVLCETAPVDPAYALAIAKGYARVLNPNAAPASCIAVKPERHAAPPDGFDARLVVTFEKTDLERIVFTGNLELSTAKGRGGTCAFIAQRRRMTNNDQTSADRLALTSAILPLAFDLKLIPDPFPNAPPDDLPPFDATMDLPQPTPK